MLILPATLLERQADDIARELKERGYRPYWVGYTEEQMIGIGINFSPPDETPWRKVFTKAREDATADSIEAEIHAWQGQVVNDIRAHKPSKTVAGAIALFGQDAVLKLMGAVQ